MNRVVTVPVTFTVKSGLETYTAIRVANELNKRFEGITFYHTNDSVRGIIKEVDQTPLHLRQVIY